MRDGTRLFTIIYSPRDQSAALPYSAHAHRVRHPAVRARRLPRGHRPQQRFRPGRLHRRRTRTCAGKFKSEGEFIHHSPIVKGSTRPNESTDTYDTIDWLVKNVPNNNGRVGQWGISWAGWEVSMGMIGAHPALKASSPQAPPQDQFLGDDHHSGGAFQLMYAFAWMSQTPGRGTRPTEQGVGRFDYGTPDGYRFFLELGAAANASRLFADQVPTWNDYMAHGTYDEYWQSRNVPKDLNDITHPVLIVASWFDAQDFHGPFRMYRDHRREEPAEQEHAGGRPVAARRLGPDGRRHARAHRLSAPRPGSTSASRSSSRSSTTTSRIRAR